MQVVGIDVGTFATKSFLAQNGNSSGIDVLNSVVWEITEEKQRDLLKTYGTEEGALTPGYYTKHEIGEKIVHAQECWFQFDAMAQDSPVLEAGIRNLVQQLELKTGVQVLNDTSKWDIMIALSPKETEAARNHLVNVYTNIFSRFGFRGMYYLDQMSFDILGTSPSWTAMKQETGSQLKKTIVLGNLGGGDSKFSLISDEPLAVSLVTRTVGGQKIVSSGAKILGELSSSQVTNYTELNQWIKDFGSVMGHYPNEWDDTHEKIVMYNGKEYPINHILRGPEMFFEPENPLYKLPKNFAIHRMIQESIEKTKKAITVTDSLLQEWLGCIVLTGGASQFYGMAERLKKELKELYPDFIINVKVAKDPQTTCVNGMIAKLLKFYKKNRLLENELDHYISLKPKSNEPKKE